MLRLMHDTVSLAPLRYHAQTERGGANRGWHGVGARYGVGVVGMTADLSSLQHFTPVAKGLARSFRILKAHFL